MLARRVTVLKGSRALAARAQLVSASLMVMRPDGLRILGAPPAILGEAAKNARTNQATREAALREYLEPPRLERALGPEHPALAESLDTLARGCAAVGDLTRAEPLYPRALAIPEQALGPDHPDVGATLQRHAALFADRAPRCRWESSSTPKRRRRGPQRLRAQSRPRTASSAS